MLLLVGATGGLLVARTDSSAVAIPAAGSVDVGFAQDMTVHHQQAVQMAAWARDLSTDPPIRQLAYDIESGQTAQVGRMQRWLELWGATSQLAGLGGRVPEAAARATGSRAAATLIPGPGARSGDRADGDRCRSGVWGAVGSGCR